MDRDTFTMHRTQAAALLRYRCGLVAYDQDHDEAELNAGSAAACLPILRFLFLNFSEALDNFLRSEGHTFFPDMTDEQLLHGILKAWPLLSPQKPTLGGVTVVKLLQPGSWGTDRLLFTLQCAFVCLRKHNEAVAQYNAEWLQRDMNWTNTNPQQQFDEHAIIGTDSQRERSTYAWMAEAYRAQMATIGDDMATVDGAAVDGAAEQQAWENRLLRGDIGERSRASSTLSDTMTSELMPEQGSASSSTSVSASGSASHYSTAYSSAQSSTNSVHLGNGAEHFISPPPSPSGPYHDDQPVATDEKSLLTPAAHAVYLDQLKAAGVEQLAESTNPERRASRGSRARQVLAQSYKDLMSALNFSKSGHGDLDDEPFDDTAFETGFITGETGTGNVRS